MKINTYYMTRFINILVCANWTNQFKLAQKHTVSIRETEISNSCWSYVHLEECRLVN